MLKKYLLAVSTVTLLATAGIASADFQLSSSSPYFGVEAGGDFTSLDGKGLVQGETGGPVGVNTSYKYGNSLNGWTGGAFAGYALKFNNGFYLAGEVFGDANSNKKSDTTAYTPGSDGGSIGLDSQKLYSIGFGILPGYNIDANNLVYARLGAVYSRFKSITTATILSTEIALPNTYSFNDGFWGAQLGLGYQYKLQQNLSIRAEYSYTQYQSKTFNYQTGLTNVIPISGNIKVRPDTNAIKLGLLYSFNM